MCFINVTYSFTDNVSEKEYPPVQQLQVHLENEQRVTFRPDGSHSLAALVHDTQLTGFFKANQKYEDARRLY